MFLVIGEHYQADRGTELGMLSPSGARDATSDPQLSALARDSFLVKVLFEMTSSPPHSYFAGCLAVEMAWEGRVSPLPSLGLRSRDSYVNIPKRLE